MNLEALERFKDSKDYFILTKIDSKRDNFFVGVGRFETGKFELFEYPATDTLPEATGVIVRNGHNFLRTSPIVKILDQTDNATIFETEGGIYRLEKI